MSSPFWTTDDEITVEPAASVNLTGELLEQAEQHYETAKRVLSDKDNRNFEDWVSLSVVASDLAAAQLRHRQVLALEGIRAVHEREAVELREWRGRVDERAIAAAQRDAEIVAMQLAEAERSRKPFMKLYAAADLAEKLAAGLLDGTASVAREQLETWAREVLKALGRAEPVEPEISAAGEGAPTS